MEPQCELSHPCQDGLLAICREACYQRVVLHLFHTLGMKSNDHFKHSIQNETEGRNSILQTKGWKHSDCRMYLMRNNRGNWADCLLRGMHFAFNVLVCCFFLVDVLQEYLHPIPPQHSVHPLSVNRNPTPVQETEEAEPPPIHQDDWNSLSQQYQLEWSETHNG